MPPSRGRFLEARGLAKTKVDIESFVIGASVALAWRFRGEAAFEPSCTLSAFEDSLVFHLGDFLGSTSTWLGFFLRGSRYSARVCDSFTFFLFFAV